MRLVESSDPGAVARHNAIYLLVERAVLTRAVCREVLEGNCDGRRQVVALSHLRSWIAKFFPNPSGREPYPEDGLQEMVVPENCLKLAQEIRDGSRVCQALFMMTWADSSGEEAADRTRLKVELDAYWANHAVAVPVVFF